MKRCAYSSATWVLPTPPRPYRVCGVGSTAAIPPRSWLRSCSSTVARPVKEGLRGGTSQTCGLLPGNRGPVPEASSSGISPRPSARSRVCTDCASSRPTRSTGLRLLNGAVRRTSPTRTGTSWRLVPEGSELTTDSQSARACGERR